MRILAISVLFVLAGLSSCETKQEVREYTIGFSQCTGGDAWRRAMHEEMERELSFYPNLIFEIKDAKNSTQVQQQHIKSFIAAGVDLLVVSPNEAEPITPLVEEAVEKGIPVIIVDRRTASSKYTAYVGANNYEIGQLTGQYIAELLKGKGNIAEVWGLEGSSPAVDRHRGLADVLNNYPDIHTVLKVAGEWEHEIAKAQFARAYHDSLQVDLIFGHNDVMAVGAFESLKSIDKARGKLFVGVDGLSGPNGGLQFVSDGVLNATFLYPTGGEEVINLAHNILEGKPFEKENILSSTAIDSRNVHIMMQQTDKILNQQQNIERQQKRISEQLLVYQNQRNILYVLLGGMVVIIVFGALTLLALQEKKKINKVLIHKNEEVIQQRNEIARMAEKADKATEAKFKFFTNISHEFRTPLTLILGPVEDILKSKVSRELQQDMLLVKSNALRLLNLVNQLMDFRKIENQKMQLQASENDIVSFVKDIAASFNREARKRNISLEVHSEPKTLKVYFDLDKLDKVLFNLLSNAFKFTRNEGKVSLHLSLSDNCDKVIIIVEDNGRGMSQEHLTHAFDRFYTGEALGNLSTGLGLALSKEFVDLHKGEIIVHSEKWKGTRFIVSLPLGKEHLNASEIMSFEPEEVNTLLRDLNIQKAAHLVEEDEQDDITAAKEFTVLLVEDNAELRTFLKNKLSADFNVVVASDGISGIQNAYDTVPDLIISDVMMPGKSGIGLTAALKKDKRTSHIPIMLLTARESLQHKIEGVQSGADLYITKPFNVQYLIEQSKSLIKSRTHLREHYNSALSADAPKVTSPKKQDKKFINEFTALVEEHLADASLSANEIAQLMGMSRVQVYRKTKLLLGYSVNDYVVNVRLKKAKHLLLNSQMNISEIAFTVGFSSSTYFSTNFKNHFKMTPSEFKASHLV